MRFAVITVSDRCSRGLLTDTAGPAAARLLRQQWSDSAITTCLVADDEDALAFLLEKLEREAHSLALTVGGTGLGPRDRTPEATKRVIDREAPGLAEAMRFRGAESNPYAWLSRGIAGTRGSMLIVNLPGSLRGAEDSLASILPLLKHALEVLAGSQNHPA